MTIKHRNLSEPTTKFAVYNPLLNALKTHTNILESLLSVGVVFLRVTHEASNPIIGS